MQHTIHIHIWSFYYYEVSSTQNNYKYTYKKFLISKLPSRHKIIPNLKLYFINIAHRSTYIQWLCYHPDNITVFSTLQISYLWIVEESGLHFLCHVILAFQHSICIKTLANMYIFVKSIFYIFLAGLGRNHCMLLCQNST